MNVHGSRDRDRSDSGAPTTFPSGLPSGPSSDIQQRKGPGHSSDLPEFDPAPVYEKEISDGRIRALTAAVHTSATKTSRQGDETLREKDRLLVERLAKNNFAGPEYEHVAERLVTTGYRYCLSWLKTGKMHMKRREAGRPVGPFPEAVDVQHLKDLATDTAVEGAVLFRRVALIGKRWHPGGGSSLLTYYIGACIQVYQNVYRRWIRAYHRDALVIPHEILPEQDPSDADEYIILKILLQQELDEPTWVSLKMRAEGASYAEIAEVLGRSDKSIEHLLRRGREKAADIIKRSGGHHV